MSMLLAMAPMGVEHRNVPSPEYLAPDVAREVIQALDPAAQQGAEQERGGVVEGRAKQGRHGQDDVAIDHPRVEHGAHLTDPVLHIDLRTAQAQGGFTAHRHEMLALTTV